MQQSAGIQLPPLQPFEMNSLDTNPLSNSEVILLQKSELTL
jgi:hypothetical protein